MLFRWIVCFLLASLSTLDAGQRAALWKPEHRSGAQRLALKDLAWIVSPANAGETLQAAIKDLTAVTASAGHTIEQRESGHPKHAIVLELIAPTRGGLTTPGAFVIYRERTRVFIRAGMEEGLVNGLYAIMADWYGARWYWPSEIGLEFVGEPLAKVPEGIWRERPAFVQRKFYPWDTDWGRQNRLIGRYSFNHNLARVFDRECYAAEPEVFPTIRGRRSPPKGNCATDGQPDFTHPRTVEISAEAAIAHFEANPESTSFSLSINDNTQFDESSATKAAVSPLQYFRQRPDYTNLVFGYMNEVAEAVFDEAGLWETPSGQPRYLTALAYYWTEQSPAIQLHPRVMPVLTSDRAQWHDPAYREEDRALIERWAASGAERIATWDYYFGAPYPYPRQFNQWIAESLKHLQAEGVDVFFSQLPSVWGLDGAKAWLASHLLWDPQQDAAALLDEFYANFFGPAAAPLREFYELAEAHRTTHAGKADWIKFYKDEAGIEMLLPVLPQLRECIQKGMTQVAPKSRYGRRIKVVSDAFQLTEYYADFHRARLALIEACFAGEVAPELSANFLTARDCFLNYAEDLYQDPLHQRLKAFSSLRQSDPMHLAAMHLPDPPALEDYRAQWEIAQRYREFGGQPVLRNQALAHAQVPWRAQSFLGPKLPMVREWRFSFRPYQHFKVEPIPGYTDNGVRLTGTDMCSFYTNVDVSSEQAYVFEFEGEYQISPDNRTHLIFKWFGADRKRMHTILPLQLPNAEAGKRVRLQVPLQAPEGAVRLRISFLVSRQYEGDYLDIRHVNLLQVNDG